MKLKKQDILLLAEQPVGQQPVRLAGGTAGGRAPTRRISDADAKERRGSRCEGGGQTGDINTSG